MTRWIQRADRFATLDSDGVIHDYSIEIDIETGKLLTKADMERIKTHVDGKARDTDDR